MNAHPCGIEWLEDFVQYYKTNYGEFNPAGWHFHIYPEVFPWGWTAANQDCSGTWQVSSYDRLSFSSWQSDALNTLRFVCEYGEPDDEIWFTEMGCGVDSFDKCADDELAVQYMSDIVNWLNGPGRWVNRYAWYTDWNPDTYAGQATWLYTDQSVANKSPLGSYYASVEPAASIGLLCESVNLPFISGQQ